MTPFADLRERGDVWDAVILFVVPTVLLFVGNLPAETRQAFVFSYKNPTMLTGFTAHFVHLTRSHLLVNLTSYLVIAPIGYTLAVVSGRRVQYLTAFVAIILALPVTLSYLNLAFVRPRVGYGFSGVAMGLLGLLTVELFVYAGQIIACLRDEDAAGMFFAEVALIGAIVRPQTQATLVITGIAGVLTVGYAVIVVRQLRRNGDIWTARVRQPGYLEIAAAAIILLIGFPFVAFPNSLTNDGTILNLYTHLLGFALAFVTAYIYLMITDPESPNPGNY